MAYTQSQIEALKKAMATGVRSVTHQGVTTVYRDRDEMVAQLAVMEAEVAATDPDAKTPIRRVRMLYTKGL